MDQNFIGNTIRALRMKKQLTQAELAQLLHVSDKTVSKWETGKGCPDVTLWTSIARALDVSLTELACGQVVRNVNVAANVARAAWYVCPVCGNVLLGMGEAVIQCHGLRLAPLQAEAADEHHAVSITEVEDEYFVQIRHEMSKQHYISFVAAVTTDGIQLTKLYPEGSAEARFKRRTLRQILFCCNQDGLFTATPPRP